MLHICLLLLLSYYLNYLPHTTFFSHMLRQHVAKQLNVAVEAVVDPYTNTNYIVSAYSAHTHRHIVAHTKHTHTQTQTPARKYKIYTKWRFGSTIETKKTHTQSLLKVCQHAAHACNKSLSLSIYLFLFLSNYIYCDIVVYIYQDLYISLHSTKPNRIAHRFGLS